MTKPPTKKELQALAVRALGEGAGTRVFTTGRGPCALAWKPRGDEMVRVYDASESTATRALAAALRALAEVKRD